ncbi:terminase small subunit [Pontibacterium sp.]|uniref:terminase small subunit n=1 Tax=Pontibacterium sp. TaxID=2036026 RepID=UPI003562790F
MPKFKWTDKRELFCAEYLACDLNATRAAIKAGYAEKNAVKEASRLMQFPEILQRIAELKAERIERTKIDADYVLRQAVKLHERCMQEVTPKTDRKGEQLKDEEGNAIFEFDSSGAARSLELVGKHIGVQAFKEKLDVEVGAKKSLQELLREAAQDE